MNTCKTYFDYIVGITILSLLGVIRAFQQGIVLEGGQDVLLTDSYWRVSLQYNLSQLVEETGNLSSLMVEVKSHFDGFFQKLLREPSSSLSPLLVLERGFKYEYATLQQMVSQYVDQVGDLVSLLPRRRPRRGLIDAGGHVLKYLFGTMDSADFEDVNSKLDSLKTVSNEIIHNSNDQITVINGLQSILVSNTKTISQVVSTLKKYHVVMHDTVSKVFSMEKAFHSQIQNLYQYLKLSAALTDIRGTITSAVQKVTRFHQAIDDLAAGKLGSNLLLPHEFIHILQSIERELAAPTTLYLPVSLETIHQYYSTAIVQVYSVENLLRVIIRVPLKTDEKLFQSYNLITYPVYKPLIKRWAQWEVEDKILMISKDRLWYTVYSREKFRQECKTGDLIVCPLSHVILSVHKRPSCAVELFGKEEPKSCKRKLISGLASPVLVKTPSGWMYSTSEEHKLTLNCYGGKDGLNVTSITIQGIGQVTGTETCDILNEGFKVPARINGYTNILGKLGEMSIPDVKALLTEAEDELVHSDLEATLQVLQGLDEELGTACVREYSLEGVFHRLQSQNQIKYQIRTVTYYTATVVCTVIVLIGTFCAIRLRLCAMISGWFMRRGLRRQERRAVAITRALELLGRGEPVPAAPGETSKGSTDGTPTTV